MKGRAEIFGRTVVAASAADSPGSSTGIHTVPGGGTRSGLFKKGGKISPPARYSVFVSVPYHVTGHPVLHGAV